jgi:hypothetical protein
MVLISLIHGWALWDIKNTDGLKETQANIWDWWRYFRFDLLRLKETETNPLQFDI